MFFVWLKDCLSVQKTKFVPMLILLQSFAAYASDLEPVPEEHIGLIAPRIQEIDRSHLNKWLDTECFPFKTCCPDPVETGLFWTGAATGLTVGPTMYNFGADLAEELHKRGKLASLSPEVLGVSSLISNVVVFSASSGEALSGARPLSAYAKPLVLEETRDQLAWRYTKELLGPGQFSLCAAFPLMLYNHSRFVGPLGNWVILLDLGLMGAATLSDYFFWSNVIRLTPQKFKRGFHTIAPANWSAPTSQESLLALTEQVRSYLLTAPPSEINNLAGSISAAYSGLEKAQILLMCVPEQSHYRLYSVIYHETIGILGAIVGVISCYPNYKFTYDLSKAVMMSWGAQDILPFRIFCGYLGICGTLSVAVSSPFGNYYSLRTLAQMTTDVSYFFYDAYKKRKKPRCCHDLNEVAQFGTTIGRYVLLPAGYLSLSFLSTIPQEYIGLMGSSSALLGLGLTTITISGVAISYWGFDKLFKKVVASPKRQMLLHATNKIAGLAPSMKESIASYFYGGLKSIGL